MGGVVGVLTEGLDVEGHLEHRVVQAADVERGGEGPSEAPVPDVGPGPVVVAQVEEELELCLGRIPGRLQVPHHEVGVGDALDEVAGDVVRLFSHPGSAQVKPE